MKSNYSPSKKGNLNLLVPGILTLILAAALLTFGLIITEKLVPLTATSSVTTVNETLTSVEGVGETVAGATKCGFKEFIVIAVTNRSTGYFINSGNYTYTSAGLIKSTTSNALVNNTNWNVTYSYDYGTSVCEDTNKTVVGLGTFADFWEIIVLAIVITIVISLLLIVFARRSSAR